ncbi:hypothetical protein [Clostridium sp. DL1XJH146]
MGSNIDYLKELLWKLDDNLNKLDEEIDKLKDLNQEDQFQKIFSLVDKKEELLLEIKNNIEKETLLSKELEELLREIYSKALIVTEKEMKFYSENKIKIKNIMLQIRKKDKVNNEYMKKITNSYFIDKKIT